ncbi:phage tail tape measure protein [Streptomyces sp. WI03-4A]|uniref:phage tail tape measure protein n=1 Tax=Streptomyces sp. WI03-4A TaxID=3028706 RepID=UPI0029A3E345|nr:phage tail tape measure protein [Streptomyces sp. WI03-4A]MDX2590984.1 phage tail tape measure protein [Streptomyces sp. WI03-4A]
MSALPPVFIEFLGSATGFMTTAKGVKTELATVEAEGGGNMRRLGGVAKAALLGIGVAAGVTAVKTTHMAADFQTQMTRVRTGAGEAAKNMDLVSNGVLKMAGQVGESTKDLTSGLYMVESAGYHGQKALDVLRVSAEGAKVGAADLATVTDAVTTAMNAYGDKAGTVTNVMNALVGTEAEGKTNLEALAGSMSGILPVAAAAHVKLNDVLGAMATMTSQGTDARVAATYLRQTIGQLSNPSAKAATTMKGLGLDANKVAKELGSKGLAATLTTLTDAIKSKMGPGGEVLIKSLQKAASKGKDFNSVLEKTSGTKKTYIGSLATMVGGTKSMMGALQLTGPHMATFRKNVDGISEHVKEGGKHVEGWADVQKTFNQRMAEFKGSAEAIGISIGIHLLPAATKFMAVMAKGLTFLASHSNVLKTFGVILGGVTIGLAAASIASWSFTDSLLANPITWIVAGIIALIAGLALLITHWKQVWGWIKSNIPFVAHLFKATWDNAVKGFHRIWDWGVKAVQHLAHWFNANVLVWLKARGKELQVWWKQHGKEVEQVWSVMWKHIKLLTSSMWSAIKIIFKVGAQTIATAWTLIKDTASLAWHAVSGIVTTALHGIENTIALVLDIVTGHWSQAWQDLKKLASDALHDVSSTLISIGSSFGTLLYDAGRSIVQGLISGVNSMIGAAASAVSNLASELVSAGKSALHINSPSRIFRDQVGKSIPEGLALGITQNAGLAHGAIRNTADGMVKHFSQRLGINSPSKVFRSLGIYIHEGLVKGLTGSLDKVKAAISRTETLLMNAYNRLGDLSKVMTGHGRHRHRLYSDSYIKSHQHAVKHLEEYVKKEGKTLEKLAKDRDKWADKVKKAQAKLKDLQKAWKDERSNIAGGIMGSASVVLSAPESGGPVSAADVLANLQNQSAAAIRFSKEIEALKKKGLRADLIEQIASAGVDGGGATADALMNASKAQIDALNAAQKNAKKAANKAGGAVADEMYKAGIHSAEGLVKGLKSKEKAIEKQMEKIAKAMAKAIKKELGIKSPSRVFHEIGQWVTAGLVNGVDDGTRDVKGASERLSVALRGGTADYRSAVRDSKARMHNGHGSVNHHVHIEVHGSVRSDRDLRDVVIQEMQRYGGRNSATWQQFKR